MQQQLGRTWQRRPDLLEQMTLTLDQKQSLAEFIRLTEESEK
jgi:tRNA (guanine37-N1)-methyltransferase